MTLNQLISNGIAVNIVRSPSNRFVFSKPVTSNLVLIARWEKVLADYTVTFIVDDSVTSEVIVKENSTVNEPATPTKAGYSFDGWYLSDAKFNFSTPITQDITLIAKFTEDKSEATTYTVTFVTGTSDVISLITVKSGTTIYNPGNLTREGYDFKGWYNGNSQFNFSTPITSDLTLTAKWEKADVYHKVYFSDGTGTNIVNVKSGDKVSEPSIPVKAGYNFQGWCGDAAGKTANYNFDKEVTSDLWLYAKWEEASKPASVTPEPEPEPSEPELEPESKTPSRPEPKPQESKPQESKEPDPKPDPSSKIEELAPELDEEVVTPIEPEIEVESTTEEVTVVEDDDVSEIETEYSNTIAPISMAPVGTDKTENTRDWLWLILLIFLLLLLPLLFLLLLLAVRRVKVFAEVITDSADEVDFQQIYKTFIETKDDVYQISIPSRATQDCFSDTFKVLLTEHFVKKHAGEELHVGIDIGEEHFDVLFVIEEGMVELLFNLHEDNAQSTDVIESFVNTQETPPFSN